MVSTPNPKTRTVGREGRAGRWVVPLAPIVVTAARTVAAVPIPATGRDGGTPDAGSAAAGRTTSSPATGRAAP